MALTAVSGQPAGTRPATGKFFSMYVPTNFTDNFEPRGIRGGTAFEAPSSKAGTEVGVVVVADTTPTGTVIERCNAMVMASKADGVKDLTCSTVKWPGAKSAVLVQWTEKRRGSAATWRSWQLMAQVNDHLVVTAGASAPVTEFDKAGLVKIMQTFRPHA